MLTWDDALEEGPVPLLPPDELREVRARFLSECGWGSVESIGESLARRDAALGAAERLVLWFEHDLYDQLQLLQVLAQAAGEVELIQADAFLGELDEEGLAALWPERRAVGPELVETARAAWDAVRSPEPAAIEAFLARDSSALPFLAPALRRLLEELPDTRGGLSRAERQLLDALAEGARTPAEAFVAAAAREEAPFDGDTWAWRRLALLGEGERSLVTALPLPPPAGDETFAATPVALTEAGRAVLAGEADRVELLGIDRWVGGTHLRPGHVPRWDADAGRIAA